MKTILAKEKLSIQKEIYDRLLLLSKDEKNNIIEKKVIDLEKVLLEKQKLLNQLNILQKEFEIIFEDVKQDKEIIFLGKEMAKVAQQTLNIEKENQELLLQTLQEIKNTLSLDKKKQNIKKLYKEKTNEVPVFFDKKS